MTHRRAASFLMFMFLGALAAPVLSEDIPYIGSKKCKKCHLAEYESWEKTKMASALTVLKPGERKDAKIKAKLDPEKDYSKDPACLPCHTTGYGKPGGFVDFETTPTLAGVGCEMCHGAGGKYVAKEFMSTENDKFKKADLVPLGFNPEIKAATCTTLCHNTKSPFVGKDYVFDFEGRRKQGTHENTPLQNQH